MSSHNTSNDLKALLNLELAPAANKAILIETPTLGSLLAQEQRLTAFHVSCLRVISEALGHPFKGGGGNAMELATLAAQTIRSQQKRIEELEGAK